MHITSVPVGGSAHVLSDTLHSQTEQAHPHASDGVHQPLIQASNSLANFHPAGGLHPIAGGQATSSAKEGGLAGFLHSLANSIVGGDAWDRLKKAVEALPGEGEEDDEPE
jgi:hypothetical protein